jgi:hypothetical protein
MVTGPTCNYSLSLAKKIAAVEVNLKTFLNWCDCRWTNFNAGRNNVQTPDGTTVGVHTGFYGAMQEMFGIFSASALVIDPSLSSRRMWFTGNCCIRVLQRLYAPELPHAALCLHSIMRNREKPES